MRKVQDYYISFKDLALKWIHSSKGDRIDIMLHARIYILHNMVEKRSRIMIFHSKIGFKIDE